MRKIFLISLFGICSSTHAQHATRIFDPFDKQTRVNTDEFQIKGTHYGSTRSIDSLVFLKIEGWGKGADIVNEHDNLILITPKDTLIIKPTGTQEYHEIGHGYYTQEYNLGLQNLERLSKEPLISIWRYYASGVEEIRVPAKNQAALMNIWRHLLSEIRK